MGACAKTAVAAPAASPGLSRIGGGLELPFISSCSRTAVSAAAAHGRNAGATSERLGRGRTGVRIKKKSV